MKAVLFDRYGGPEVLRLAEAPAPLPLPGEMLIRVRATGVNPADGKWRSGMFDAIAPIGFPHVGGYDVAGEVLEGDGLPAGTRVVAMVDSFRAGAYAEMTVATADRVAILPDPLDFATGAALPTPGLTGVQLIEEALDVQPGQRVLVTGATGAVGRFAVHAAKARGAIVIAAVRAAARETALKMGVDEVIILDGGDYAGAPFDRIADTIGGGVVAPLCRRAASGAIIRTAATQPIPADGVPVEISFFMVHPDAARLERIARAVAAGEIAVAIADRLPLGQAADAQRRVDAGSTGGKIVLEP
jgi:NADPH2:quinone reductase